MKGITIMSEWDTLMCAVEGRSLYRFGDGEYKIIQGHSAKSQEYDKRLAAIMRRSLIEPGNSIPCIPTFDRNGPKWRSFWHRYESLFRPLLSKTVHYGSSLVTRPDSAPHIDTPAFWNAMRSLWAGKDVILIRGSGKSLTQERLIEAASVQEILCPVRHAFSEYDNLCRIVRAEHGGRTVILCCGATATAMAYELGNEGIHCVDLGHAGLTIGRREGQYNTEGK